MAPHVVTRVAPHVVTRVVNNGKLTLSLYSALSPNSAKPEDGGCVVCVLVLLLCVGEILGLLREAGKLGLWVWRVGLGDQGKKTKNL